MARSEAAVRPALGVPAGLEGLATASFTLRARAVRGDDALPLRLMSSVYRRGIDLVEAHFVTSPTAVGTRSEDRLVFTGRFVASGRQAITVLHTIRSVIGVERVELEVDA
jgi:hypothetical protein